MSDSQQEVMRVDLTWEGGVAIVTINNVRRRNAISPPIQEQLLEHLLKLNRNKDCRAIVLTGAQGVFCAGGDVKAQQERAVENPDYIERRIRMWKSKAQEVVRLMVLGPKPVVTAVEGPAFGAGLSLAIASDVTVASRTSRYAAAQILRGLLPDVGLFYLLANRAGMGRSRELLLSGREFDAEEALRHCVAHELCEPGEALAAAVRRAEQLAAVPPLAYALTKAALYDSCQSLEDCFRAERDYQPTLGMSRDHKESVAAFLGKRKAVYTGE